MDIIFIFGFFTLFFAYFFHKSIKQKIFFLYQGVRQEMLPVVSLKFGDKSIKLEKDRMTQSMTSIIHPISTLPVTTNFSFLHELYFIPFETQYVQTNEEQY